LRREIGAIAYAPLPECMRELIEKLERLDLQRKRALTRRCGSA